MENGRTVTGRLFDELAHFGRNIGYLAAAFGVLWWLAGDKIEPYRQLPVQMEILLQEFNPELIQTKGEGIVINPIIKVGDEQSYTYNLIRVASCDTEISQRLWNIEQKRFYNGPIISAQKSPVTRSYHFFTVNGHIIPSVPTGWYVISNIISPKDCGVYNGDFSIESTEKFFVINPDDIDEYEGLRPYGWEQYL